MNPWIEHKGGECPIPDATEYDVKLRDGHVTYSGNVIEFRWPYVADQQSSRDIIAYRLIGEQS